MDKPLPKKIALIFDCDDTLTADTTDAFIKSIGIDSKNFWRKEVRKRLDNGWDPVLAFLTQLLKESGSGHNITFDKFSSFARGVKFFPGVSSFLDRIRLYGESLDSRLEIEYYIISSGIGDIITGTSIASKLKWCWASNYSYSMNGNIEHIKNVINFTDKTRCLIQISKGLVGKNYITKPMSVNKRMDPEQLVIPFQRMIYIGDGLSDIPSFALLKKYGGTPIAVYEPGLFSKWSEVDFFKNEDRVNSVFEADYRAHSPLTLHIEQLLLEIATLDPHK